MTDPAAILPESVKRTCHVCRRRRKPEAMDGTRCADRESGVPREARSGAARVTDPARGPTTEERGLRRGKCSLCGRHGWIVQSLGRWVCWESCNNGPQ